MSRVADMDDTRVGLVLHLSSPRYREMRHGMSARIFRWQI